MAGKPWSVQAIVASLEKQAAVHRELEAKHAEKETFHREQRSTHAAELEAITRVRAEPAGRPGSLKS